MKLYSKDLSQILVNAYCHTTTTFVQLYFPCIADKQHLLAVGDSSGTLHILEIPWSLRLPAPNEVRTGPPVTKNNSGKTWLYACA
ncbi:hypothetical protein DPMN_192649 [Dreissena polymorpha]|uniref:Uncharacterized protein n=1 Tax=Dreissena polymorpha TaxID=45954 RepID=A0A9D4BFB2_DREPO|nr:hypothetical protein DPMN_192649 [Dreissena polymorpha]